jgi:hypothetical protein
MTNTELVENSVIPQDLLQQQADAVRQIKSYISQGDPQAAEAVCKLLQDRVGPQKLEAILQSIKV